ncbi:MAG: PilZ domain-containing protein [bacterium]|nr:PilZ domain-containing protein [bacterium]
MPRRPDPPGRGARTASANRRRFSRRRKPFSAVYFPTQEERMPAIGLDISGGGLCLLTQQPLPPRTACLSAVVLIGDRPVSIGGEIRWRDTVNYQGRPHYRYGLRFVAIDDVDWEHIMRFATGEGDAIPSEGSTLDAAQRDALVPSLAQRRIVEKLVQSQRLDRPRRPSSALVEYRFDGYMMRQGVPYLRLTVRSKRTLFDTVSEFRTKVLVPLDDPARDIVVLG